jgi:hypothetical protein
MRTALRISVVVIAIIVALFAAAQLIRPERTNPMTNASHTIQAKVGAHDGLVAVLNRGACLDCHSNATVWPKYTTVAPMSWLIAYAVTVGRRAVNFSEWTTYEPENQRKLLAEACQDVANGKMPGSFYTTLYPEARLSDRDVETICASAR